MSNLRDLNLKPRAVAILVALRNGARSVGQLADAICDDSSLETTRLLTTMQREHRLVRVAPGQRRTFALDYDGIGWLQSHGLDATEQAKNELYDVLDAVQS